MIGIIGAIGRRNYNFKRKINKYTISYDCSC